MFFQYVKGRRSLPLLVTALLALVIGCTDNPLGFVWDHTYPEGLVVREDGAVRLTVDKTGKVSGDFSVGAGRQSGQLDVVFLDEDGVAIVPASDEYLEVTVTHKGLATFQQGKPGSFQGRFRGLKAGRTSVLFKFKQGVVGEGKGHWTSPAITLTVTP